MLSKTITIGLTTRPLQPACSSSEPLGIAMGSGAVFVPQVEANKMEKDGSPFADLPLSFGVVFVDTVDLAESTRRDGVPDRRVDKSENEYSLFC